MPAIWFKPGDRVNPAWFGPLERLAERVADDPDLPPVNPDHFLYAARIERDGYAELHAYRHIASRKFLNIDDNGLLWRYTASDKIGTSRYAPFASERDALASAELVRGNLLAGHLRAAADPDARVPAVAQEVRGRSPQIDEVSPDDVTMSLVEFEDPDLVDAAYESRDEVVAV